MILNREASVNSPGERLEFTGSRWLRGQQFTYSRNDAPIGPQTSQWVGNYKVSIWERPKLRTTTQSVPINLSLEQNSFAEFFDSHDPITIRI